MVGMGCRMAAVVLGLAVPLVACAVTTVEASLRPELSGTDYGQPFLRGQSGVVDLFVHNCPGQWCDFTDRTSVYLHLPPGLSYASHVGMHPTWVTCTAGPVEAAGQVVRCTGAGLSGNPNAITKSSGAVFTVNVAPDAPPGSAPIHAAVDEESPEGSTTLAQCMLDAAPAWCAVMDLGIAIAPVPELVFMDGSWSQGGLEVGAETGTVRARFRNIGALAASNTNIQVQLPRGVYWRASGNASDPSPFTCSSSGSVDPGYVLRCSTSQQVRDGAEGYLQLGLNPGALVTGSMPVLFAIDSEAAPAAGALDQCALDPERADCLLLEVPLKNGCDGRFGSDGIFCNGYEPRVP